MSVMGIFFLYLSLALGNVEFGTNCHHFLIITFSIVAFSGYNMSEPPGSPFFFKKFKK